MVIKKLYSLLKKTNNDCQLTAIFKTNWGRTKDIKAIIDTYTSGFTMSNFFIKSLYKAIKTITIDIIMLGTTMLVFFCKI